MSAVPTRWVQLHTPTYTAAFALDPDGGGMVETIDFWSAYDGGHPDWVHGGFCDELRGEDPELQRLLEAVLHYIQGRQL